MSKKFGSDVVTRHSVAYIKVMDVSKSKHKIEHKKYSPKYTICKLSYIEYDNKDYEWVFEPMWDAIDSAPEEWRNLVKHDLPGLMTEYREDKFRFKNTLPPFVYQRTIPPNRGDALEEAKIFAGMDYYDRFDYMVKTRCSCGNDDYVVEDNPDNVFDPPTPEDPERTGLTLDAFKPE